MSVAGKVGGIALTWVSAPAGGTGFARALLADGGAIDVSWWQDRDGLWMELPHGIFGFDLEGEPADDGRVSFRVTQRGQAAEWVGLGFSRAGEAAAAGAAAGARKVLRVRAQMPGKILKIAVRDGQEVTAGQSLLVMEAMKMENDIKATAAGRVKAVKISEGQAVETGADLLLLDPL